MKRQYLPIDALPAWARLNDISFYDVDVRRLLTEDGVDKGSAVVATRAKAGKDLSSGQEDAEDQTLMRIPSDLVLSLERVEMYAKSDRYLREVLDAVGEFGMTARGAILTYLLLLITHSSLELSERKEHREHVGVSSPWTEYIKFIPESFDLPTFYTAEEYELLRGTSLEPALDSKLDSLGREFEHLRKSTADIPWCKRNWWGEEMDTGQLTFTDWKTVDAMYRSRALDLPDKGHAMVPCVDMANHAAGEGTGAVYETDSDGNAILQLRWGQKLDVGDEVTITYGDEKGASEMIFSYGFLECDIDDARQLFLDLDIPGDDPLKPAKKAVCDEAPGVRLFAIPDSPEFKTDWESEFVWWICINEEDGLDFCILQSNDGEKELKVFWKEEEIDASHKLRAKLMKDPMWDVFQLRAVVTVQERVAHQLSLLRASQESVEELIDDADESVIRKSICDAIMKLRDLEDGFLARCSRDLEEKKMELFNSPTVKAYLGTYGPGADISEDFS